jgi:hypothetical protein
MATWIILGVVYVVALVGLRRAGGFASAGSVLQDWGHSVSRVCRSETASRSL